MSKLKLIQTSPSRVTTRIAATEIPLHLCFETLSDIDDGLRHYHENAAIEVEGVLFVQDAP